MSKIPDPLLRESETNGSIGVQPPNSNCADDVPLLKALQSLSEELNQGEDEDEDLLRDKVWDGTWGNLTSENLLKDERERGLLLTRTKQSMLHTALSEKRILYLEEKMAQLMRDVYNETGIFKVKKKKCDVFRHVLHRSNLNDFHLSVMSSKAILRDLPALEALVLDHALITENQMDSGETSASHANLERCVERLRIRPVPLINHLHDLSGGQFDMSYRTGKVPAQPRNLYTSLVILRPFKFFVNYSEQIRKSAVELEKSLQFGHQPNMEHPSSELSSPDAEEEEEDFDKQDLLLDLKRVIEFLDVDLAATFKLRDSIQNGTAIDIEFEDLWHLFELGGYVTSQSHQNHAYRVINYTGGREPLTTYIARGEKIHPVDGLTVDCYCLLSDGTSYVPKLERFCIRRFVGRQPIASLAVFPLKFHPRSKELQHTFLKQGRRFLDLTQQPFSHLLMKGKTLDEPSNDIDAPVIIDMSLAINTVPEWRPKERLSADDLTRSDLRETFIKPHCAHGTNEGCCGSDIAFKDLKMDETRLSAFLGNNLRMLAPRKADGLLNEEIMLLPHWVYGFVLRSRQWVKLRTIDLSPVQFENDFDELMLPDTHKRTVLSLVQNHENARMKSATGDPSIGAGLDLVRGKGSGLIILLHGSPGK